MADGTLTDIFPEMGWSTISVIRNHQLQGIERGLLFPGKIEKKSGFFFNCPLDGKDIFDVARQREEYTDWLA
jgi:hypothetical protein